MKYFFVAFLLSCVFTKNIFAQFFVDANFEFTIAQYKPNNSPLKPSDNHFGINSNFRYDDPFNPFRGKIFLNYNMSSTFHFDAEVLFDSKAKKINTTTRQPFRFDGFFLAGNIKPEFNFWIGKIPSPVGNFSPRSYAHKNPLIGFPLMYHYKLPLPGINTYTNTQLLSFRDALNPGVTQIYEACWLNGVTLFGMTSRFQWSGTVAKGTFSNPEASHNKGYQFAGRITTQLFEQLRIGASAGVGPYLERAHNLPQGTALEDPKHRLYAAEFRAEYYRYELFGELALNEWDTPLLREKKVEATSYYGELRYQVSPVITLTARVDNVLFGSIEDTSGVKQKWGYDVKRTEAGIIIKFIPEFIVKSSWQHNEVATLPKKTALDIYALQIVVRWEDIFDGEKKKEKR
jgi:hypothetical protein